MDTLGTDFNNTGSVMSRSQLQDLRRKRGECVRCGRKCFRKKLFKMIPITEPGMVFEGRCLRCKPVNNTDDDSGPPSMHRQTTPLDRQRFERSQSNLSSRNLDISGMSSFSNLSGRRPISRTHSAQQRSDNRSVGSSSTSSRPHMAGRKPRESPLSAPVRPLPNNSTAGDDGQATRLRLNITSLSEADVVDDDEISLTDFQTNSSHRDRSIDLQTNSSHRERSVFAQSHSAIQTQSSAIPEMRSTSAHRERTCFTPTARRASHSDAQMRADAMRALSYDRPSDSVVPTPEELQRAAMTILVAKQSGIYEDVFPAASEYSAFNDQLETLSTDRDIQDGGYDDLPIGFQHRGSHRSLRSGSSPGETKPIDEIDGYEYPSHGILNRGGTFPISQAMNGGGRPVVGGSSRTLSSMSSLEEDVQLPAGVTNSMRGIAVEALYEESDDHSALSGHSSREQMEREALHQLGNGGELLTDQEYILKLRQVENDFGEILIILREAITSSVVARYGLEDLASVQLTQEDHDVLADMGAPHVIAEVMEAHTNSLAVQLWGCGAIWNMSGALDVILVAMSKFIESVELQEKAIATISNLGAAENNLSFLCDQGGVSRIVEAMNTHSEVATVQIRGCAAVTNLASHDTPLKQHIVECGAGGAVVVAMVMHPNDSYLQEKALRALRNLCANSEVNKVELANIGGIDAVISAMQVHRDEAGVQEEGAWTLSNLAGNDGNKAVIGDCGGIDVVIRAMWVHSDHVGVQEWCCRALFTLTLDPHNGEIVLMVGGISAIVNTMQAHGDSPTVQEMGCAVLGNLASTDQSRMRIVNEEALDAIVLAMVLHADDIQVQEQACMVLLRLTIEANRQSMQAANIPELARTAAQKFPERCTEAAEQLLQAFGTHI
eukprot:Nitzschia sp. Nitz4//scaffold1_size375055//12361//15069//NITZ4_000206-RA/size375055-processed-gene-0.100-mRNA-1//-1//CDS//3329540835//8010//frame0